MIVLGIDPGTAEMGAGVVRRNGKRVEYLFHTCIKTPIKDSQEKRLYTLNQKVVKIIKKYKPCVVAIESLFFFSNAKSVNAVGQAIGAVMIAAAQEKIKVKLYSPPRIKKELAGYGRATKRQLQSVVRKALHKRKLLRPTHAADALAVALCHLKQEGVKLT